jgi:acetolactate synthase small subunit
MDTRNQSQSALNSGSIHLSHKCCLYWLQGLKHQVESLQAEVKRKESALDRLDSERQRLAGLVDEEKVSSGQEKQALVEEIVMLKKHMELQNRSQAQQNAERVRIKDDSRKSYTALVDAEKKSQILRDQVIVLRDAFL